MLKKEDGRIDWSRPAAELHNQVRGLDPWPGAYTHLAGEPLKLAGTRPDAEPAVAAPGTVLGCDTSGLRIVCGTGVLSIGSLQLPGRKRQPAADFLRGRPLPPGTRLGA
jgi:methionyl-tRNA formyltransferase